MQKITEDCLTEIQDINEDILTLETQLQEKRALLRVKTSEVLKIMKVRVASNAICMDCGTILQVCTNGNQKIVEPCSTCEAKASKLVAAE